MDSLRGAIAGAAVLNIPGIAVVPHLPTAEVFVFTVATACAGAGLGGLIAWSFSKPRETGAARRPAQTLEREAA